MIIPDLNILLYAFNKSAPLYLPAARWWEAQVNSGEIIGIPWVVLLGFVRLLTGRQLVQNPFRPEEIVAICNEWFSFSNVRLLENTAGTYRVMAELLVKYQLSGPLVTDACIVAQVIEEGAQLYSNDSDFLRFSEITVTNPF